MKATIVYKYLHALTNKDLTFAEIYKKKHPDLRGPGNWFLTRMLEKLFGRSKTFKTHAMLHDVFGNIIEISKKYQDNVMRHHCGFHLFYERTLHGADFLDCYFAQELTFRMNNQKEKNKKRRKYISNLTHLWYSK